MKVSELSEKKVVSITSGMSIQDAIKQLAVHGVSAIPVKDVETGVYMGNVDCKDVIKFIAEASKIATQGPSMLPHMSNIYRIIQKVKWF